MKIKPEELKVGLLITFDEERDDIKKFVNSWGSEYKNQIAEIIEIQDPIYLGDFTNIKTWWPTLNVEQTFSVAYFKKVNE